MLKQAFNSIVQNVDSNTDPHRAIKKVVMKSLGERDYCHLHSSLRRAKYSAFVYVSNVTFRGLIRHVWPMKLIRYDHANIISNENVELSVTFVPIKLNLFMF